MSKFIKTITVILGLCLIIGCFAGCDMSDGFVSPTPKHSPSATVKPSSSVRPSVSPSMLPDVSGEPDSGTPDDFQNGMPDNNVPGSNNNNGYDNMPTNNAGANDDSDNSRFFRSPAQLVTPNINDRKGMAD